MSQIIKRDWAKMARTAESGITDLYVLLEEKLSGLAIKRPHIFEAVRKAGLNAEKPTTWSEDDLLRFLDTLRKIAKPMLIAANKIDLEPSEQNADRLKNSNYMVVPCTAEAELALRRAAEKGLIDYRPGDSNFNILKTESLTEAQKKALQTVKEKVLIKFGTTGVQEAINMAYFKLLNMIVVYPVEDIEKLADHKGNVLPDAYVVPYGTTARQLAYLIHTEMGEGFIYAVEARERRRIGEDYVLRDRDVISIVSAKKRA
jgi:ribosome-binding ATPase YchF (GTP1/OBG family)